MVPATDPLALEPDAVAPLRAGERADRRAPA
jgi:hypothetical protein